MNNKFCFSVFFALVFSFSLLGYEITDGALSVEPGETVSFASGDEETVSSLSSITFADSSGVVEFKDSTFEFSGSISGSGKITALNAEQLTVSGDSRGFTGGWLITNTPMVVASRYALGDANTLGAVKVGDFRYGLYIYDDTQIKSPIVFRGNGLTNDVNVYVQRNQQSETHFNYGEPGVWVQNGRFRNLKCGNFYFSDVIFNGTYENSTAGWYYFDRGAEIVFNAPSSFSATWWSQKNSGPAGARAKIRFNASGNSIGETNFYSGYDVCLGAENVFPSTGSGRVCIEDGSYVDLQGYDQAITMISRKGNPETNAKVETVTSSVPATVTITAGQTDREYRTAAMFCGWVSLRYSSPTTYRLITAKSETRGFLEVTDGVLAIDANAQWAGTNVTVKGGQLLLNSGNSLLDDTSSLVVQSPGRLTLGSGVTAFVSEATIGGVKIAPGVYSAEDLASLYQGAGELVDGSGFLAVAQNAPEAVDEYGTWTGEGGNGLLATDANWKGGVAPDLLSGGANLSFTEGTSLATVSGDISARSLTFALSDHFELAGVPGSCLNLGYGGISVANVSQGSVSPVTNTVSANIANSITEPGDVSVGNDVVLRLKGSFTGGSGGSPVTVTASGEVIIEGDNSKLHSPLVLTTPNEVNSVPFVLRVRHPRALGSIDRQTTIVCPCIRFECLTNDVPIAVKGYGMTVYSYDGSSSVKRLVEAGRTLVLNGLMASYGNVCGSWNMDGITLRGGFKANGGGLTFVVSEGARMNLESGVDMAGSTKQYALGFSGKGDVYMSAATHGYFRISLLDDVRLVCVDEGALSADRPVCFGKSTEPKGRLDLGGTSQEVAFLSHLMCDETYRNQYGEVASDEMYGTVTSSKPAVLTINGTLTDDQCNKDKIYSCKPSNAAIKFTGLAGLHFAGFDNTAEQVLSYVKSDSTGDLRVSSGTLSFNKGAGWSGARSVLIDGTGVIATDATSSSVLFGRKVGASRATLRIDGDGVLTIPSQGQVTVNMLKIGSSENGFLPAGVYGGVDAGLDAAHTLACLSGGGTLRVRSSGPGMVMIVK